MDDFELFDDDEEQTLIITTAEHHEETQEEPQEDATEDAVNELQSQEPAPSVEPQEEPRKRPQEEHKPTIPDLSEPDLSENGLADTQELWTIHEVADYIGCTVEPLLGYNKRGLLPKPDVTLPKPHHTLYSHDTYEMQFWRWYAHAEWMTRLRDGLVKVKKSQVKESK